MLVVMFCGLQKKLVHKTGADPIGFIRGALVNQQNRQLCINMLGDVKEIQELTDTGAWLHCRLFFITHASLSSITSR